MVSSNTSRPYYMLEIRTNKYNELTYKKTKDDYNLEDRFIIKGQFSIAHMRNCRKEDCIQRGISIVLKCLFTSCRSMTCPLCEDLSMGTRTISASSIR